MNHSLSVSLLLAATLLGTGCASQLPLTSHAHMGHSLTAWHDTPNNEALLTVAEEELALAINIADAMQADSSPAAMAFRNILHTLNPDRVANGPGLNYGAIRALEGTLEHLEYAAASTDASDNLLTSMDSLVEQGESIVSHLQNAEEWALLGTRDTQADPSAISRALLSELKLAAVGSAEDEFAGIRGLHHDMQAMLKREDDPRYEPLPRRYVLGLVRLPNGEWGYRLDKPRGYGSY